VLGVETPGALCRAVAMGGHLGPADARTSRLAYDRRTDPDGVPSRNAAAPLARAKNLV
jgi:hypothetical protein